MHTREIQAINEYVDQVLRDLVTPFIVKLADGSFAAERPEIDDWYLASGYITTLLSEMERLLLLYPLDAILSREADILFDREGNTVIKRFF